VPGHSFSTADRAEYLEWPVAAGLREHLACVWVARYGVSGRPHVDRVIPDGCMDLLFVDGRLVIAGPDTRAVALEPQLGACIVGVRFRPGIAPAVLGVPARHLLDARVDASEVVGDRALAVAETLSGIRSASQAAAVLGAQLGSWIARAERPNRVAAGAVALVGARGQVRDPSVARLAAALGVGERRLLRSCADALGYGPKMFERISRLRRFVAAAAGPGRRSLAALAVDAGYADQPHLTRECRALTGVTPTALRGYPVTAA
jgi:AraC-like DNA-binding protein